MPISFAEPLIAKTPDSWGLFVLDNLKLLLSDHAYCERKAANFALSLLQRYGHLYPEHAPLSKLVREEMRHYELVLRILNSRSEVLARSATSGYARHLRLSLSSSEPARHIQMLLIAALIEARSCERFFVLSRVLSGVDEKLSVFYYKLAMAEQRHHLLYTNLACALYDPDLVLTFLQDLSSIEHAWLAENRLDYRMHSGIL